MTQLTPQQNDMLTELANIGMGHAASTLNNLIGHRVRLQVPSVEIISHAHPALTGDGSVAAVSMGFRGSFSGNAALMFPAESAAILVAALTGEAPDADLSEELRAGTLAEVGNILLNGVMGSIMQHDHSQPAICGARISRILAAHAARPAARRNSADGASAVLYRRIAHRRQYPALFRAGIVPDPDRSA
jgi:CheY-specific phosphatase CheX